MDTGEEGGEAGEGLRDCVWWCVGVVEVRAHSLSLWEFLNTFW